MMDDFYTWENYWHLDKVYNSTIDPIEEQELVEMMWEIQTVLTKEVDSLGDLESLTQLKNRLDENKLKDLWR